MPALTWRAAPAGPPPPPPPPPHRFPRHQTATASFLDRAMSSPDTRTACFALHIAYIHSTQDDDQRQKLKEKEKEPII